MSDNVFFNPISSHSQLFIHSHSRFQVQRSFVPIRSRCQSHTNISSHLLLTFTDIMEQMTSKLTKNRSLLASKTTEN